MPSSLAIVLGVIAGFAAGLTAIITLLDRFARRIGNETKAAILIAQRETSHEIEESKARILEKIMPRLEEDREKAHATEIVAREAIFMAREAHRRSLRYENEHP